MFLCMANNTAKTKKNGCYFAKKLILIEIL